MSDIIIGIDPGVSGALAVIHPTGYTSHDTPTVKVKVGKGMRTRYDLQEMVSLVKRILDNATSNDLTVECWLENVHAMPGQGVSSMFSMGRGLGNWEAIIATMRIPLNYVSPVRWKNTIMDGMGKEKDAAVLKAQQIFPLAVLRTERGRLLDGRAEALLIAEYGLRYGGNKT